MSRANLVRFGWTALAGALAIVATAASPAWASGEAPASAPGAEHAAVAPPLWAGAPFVALLLVIAVLPLVPACHRFWERNRNKLLVAGAFSVLTLLYYGLAHPAGAGGAEDEAPTRWDLIGRVLHLAVLEEFVPFIVLLLALYTISGGILLDGDLPARPLVNTAFLAVGSVLASFIGTTGAAMLLIRPLLHTNCQRKHVRHTVVFFIFLVCNIGGCLLPIGDPPLFLGYLRGVPFLWTLRLALPWAFCTGLLLTVYYVWDRVMYRRESLEDLARDEATRKPLRLLGRRNFLLLLAVVLAVGLLVPGHPLVLVPSFIVPDYFREGVLLALAVVSLLGTSSHVRRANQFTFHAIGEVAALFLGIFITMQPPLAMLEVNGPSLGLTRPWQFFWATGLLSSFLDNAPTYVVFFETANSLTQTGGEGVLRLLSGSFLRQDLLAAISLGAVFMGANTYIGNGPNFMVKAVAEQRGVKMPSFFGYMLYSLAILLPLFVLVTLVLFVWKLG